MSHVANGCADSASSQWLVGLVNARHSKYLTAETFGFKLNANGASLKKKQLWTLEPAASNGGSEVCLRSHLDRYLAVDAYGNVTGDATDKDPATRFTIDVDPEGRWAFRSTTRGYFLGASMDKLVCDAKSASAAELWTVHLAARPQVNIRSVGRKRFAHLSDALDEVHVDAAVPWGEDTLFTLEFREADGKYAIHTCNNKYVHPEGKLVDNCSRECCFSLEFHGGYLALRDVHGRYLSPIGSKALLRTRSSSVTKDELFSLEDSLPQASFVAFNNRYVSVKQGVDVTANQDEVSDHETFQLEFDKTTQRWFIRTMQDKYWALEIGGGIQANADKGTSNCLFDLNWQNDGSVCFRANNGKYVAAKKSGHLYANSDVIDDTSRFHFYLINRPLLVLKCEQGFVGYKSGNSFKLECNKASYEPIQVQRADKGICYFKGQNGKFWRVGEGSCLFADSENPLSLLLELREPSKMCIKTIDGNYLVADKNGAFKLGGTDSAEATHWEY